MSEFTVVGKRFMRLIAISWPVVVGLVISMLMMIQESDRAGIQSRDFIATRPNNVLLPLLLGVVVAVSFRVHWAKSVLHNKDDLLLAMAKKIAPIWLVALAAYLLLLMQSSFFGSIWSPSWTLVTMAIPTMTILIITAWAIVSAVVAWYLPIAATIPIMTIVLFVFRFWPDRQSSNWERHITGFLAVGQRNDVQISWATVLGPTVVAIALILGSVVMLSPRKVGPRFFLAAPLVVLLLFGSLVVGREITKNFGREAVVSRTDGINCERKLDFDICLWDENQKFFGEQLKALETLDDVVGAHGATIPRYWTESSSNDIHYRFDSSASQFERVIDSAAEIFKSYDWELSNIVSYPGIYCSDWIVAGERTIEIPDVFSAWTANQLLARDSSRAEHREIERRLNSIPTAAVDEAKRLDELDNARFKRWFDENLKAARNCRRQSGRSTGVSVEEVLKNLI